MVERHKLPFPILSDESRAVLRQYGVLHAGGGPGRSDIAVPAHVLIDRGGAIRWTRVSTLIQDRPDPKEVMAQIEKL